MHFNSFLLACITSAASTLLTENSSSLIQQGKKEENSFHVLFVVVFLNRIPQPTTNKEAITTY